MTEFVPTICPYCAVGCGMLLVIQDGRVVGVQPRPGHPASRGQLCLKGWNAHQFIHHSGRLQAPLIREGSQFREATWDEALGFVANKVGEIRLGSGSASIAVISSAKSTNEENYLIQKLVRAVLGSNNIDNCARLCHASTITGLGAAFGSSAMTNSITDIEQANCILVIGSNTTEQHPLIASRIVAAKERGASIVVADPRRVPLCNIADVYLAIKPGTDAALLNGMAYVILDLGLEDKEFIEQRTEGFHEYVEGLKEFSLDSVAGITGVAAPEIKQAAEIYAEAERAAIVYSMGITQHVSGTDNVLSIANLAMLTGNIGKLGSGVNPLRGQNNVQGACDMGCLPNMLPGYQPVADAELRAKIATIWGVTELCPQIGLTSTEMLHSAVNGKIKAMYIIGENPMISHPNVEQVHDALKRLDLLVVQDIFPTETTALAHVVLPSACWAEKEGTVTSTDRRVQKIRKAIEPPGEAKPDWQIAVKLAKLLGMADLFHFTSAEEIFEEIRRVTPIYRGITYKALEQAGGVQWPCPNDAHPGTPVLHEKQFARGKGKFHHVAYREAAETPDEHYPYLLTTGRVTSQWHTGTMSRRSPALEREHPEPFIEISPKDAQNLRIRNESTVVIASRRGKIQAKALVTPGIKPGVVFMPFHFAEAAANVLTNWNLDPVAKIPELKVCAVRIKPCDAEAHLQFIECELDS